MAKITPSLPFDYFSGKFSSRERLVFRTRNGRVHGYAIMHPYTGPLAESRKRAINVFSEASRLCKAEISDPERLAYWQDRYIRYTRLARRNPARANAQFITSPAAAGSSAAAPSAKPSNKFYSTLRGFIIASLSARLRSADS